MRERAEDSTSNPNSSVRNELALITQQFMVTQPRGLSRENGHATPKIHIFWVEIDKFCCSFTEVIRSNTCPSDCYFFSGGQINKDSALLPWGKSSVTSSTFLIHGWTQLICYTVFFINGLLRQATRANGSIWISHRQAVRLKRQPLCCLSSAPAIPQGFA